MGGPKLLPEMLYGVKKPQKLTWGLIMERQEDRDARMALELRMPRNSFQQVPRITYPQSHSMWRTDMPERPLIQPRIVEQPDPASLKKQCIYRKKLEKEKSKFKKKKSEFLLSKFVKQARPQQREIYSWNEKLEPERLKILLKYLNSSVELDQLYAAKLKGLKGMSTIFQLWKDQGGTVAACFIYTTKALGRLGLGEEHVVSALYNTLQECNSPPLEYEVARSLALLGCLEASVVKVLIRHLKDVGLNRREDTLAALKVSLQARSKFEWTYVGAQSSLTRNLERLVNLQDPLENITFNAAICLGYLDKSNLVAQETMFMCLTKNDWKKKIQALVMLVKQMDIVNDVIIQNILEMLQHSPVYKHRADSAKLLATVGLKAIQEEGFEEDVFNVLLEKLYEEPFLVVRQSVALAVEALKMKKRVWDIVEKQLKDEDGEVRTKAVISLGVLGIRQKNVFFTLLEMLDLDTSEDVRIQIIRTFSSLGMNNIYVRKSLMDKEQAGGILARECTKALKMLDKVSAVQKELMLQPYRTH